jgi:serine protease Do
MNIATKVIGVIGIAACTSLATFSLAKKYIYSDTPLPRAGTEGILQNASYTEPSGTTGGGYVNLEMAAEKASKSVVHIKMTKAGQIVNSSPFGNDDFFGQFFNQRMYQPEQKGSGSGVIISADGYIITNNHVVENANEVTVTLNDKQEKPAKVIATDPSTDLALVKIDASDLPYINYGNSDNVRLAEWVLAVGYPLGLETTVTAGIISAKSRRLGMHDRDNGTGAMAIENFLQTDAAINPGNSGGALVNAAGELIGINTAIASPTGSYAGYGYAIPSNLVKKVIEDLKKHGEVQRAVLGIEFLDPSKATPEQRSALNLDKVDGVYVNNVLANSGAGDAGLKRGDFITKINGKSVATTAQLLGQIGTYRPGDKVQLSYLRGTTETTTTVTLRNVNGSTGVIKSDIADKLGLNLKELSPAEAKQFGIARGLQVLDVRAGGIVAKQTPMKKGFIIMQLDEVDVASTAEFARRVNQKSEGQILLGGTYPGYRNMYYYNVDVRR